MNIDRNKYTNINNRWSNQIGGIHNWNGRHPNRVAHWNNWGNGVRNSFHYHQHNYFGSSWWNAHPHSFCGWHYSRSFAAHPPSYWWTAPTFVGLTSFISLPPVNAAPAQPIYYDYGQEGNVVINNNSVYVNGEQIATADEFTQSAMMLATVPPPADEQEADESEWMPLGTFAVSSNEKETEPSRVIQLAINKSGVVSGTLYNSQTDQTLSIQGQVDKETQRVAMRIGDSENIVVETGLYNLTQDQAPLLVHYGGEKAENWLLVRLDYAGEESDSSDARQF